MAVWVTHDRDTLTVHHVSALRWAVGLSIVAAMLVVIAFEGIDRNTSVVVFVVRLIPAAMVLAATVMFAPWTQLRLDSAERAVDWQRRNWLANSRVRAPFDEVESVTSTTQPTLGLVARYAVRLRGSGWSVIVPVGWSVARTVELRASALAVRVEHCLRSVETNAADEVVNHAPTAHRRRLSLRRLMVATALIALILGVSKSIRWTSLDARLPVTVMAAIVTPAIVILFRAGEAATERFLVAAIAMYGPLVWIAVVARPWGRTSGMWDGAIALPGLWAGLGFAVDVMFWPAAVATLVELTMAARIAFRGWKPTVIFSVVAGLLSCFCSFVAYAGYRM